MIRTFLRGLLLIALAVTFPAEAATRYRALQGVVFADGRTAVGSFGYDDAIQKVTTWNIRVQGAPGVLPFTYMPGNSEGYVDSEPGGPPFGAPFFIVAFAANDETDAERILMLDVGSEPVGVPTTMPLRTTPADNGVYLSNECCNFPARNVVAGSVVLVPFPPAVGLVDVIEFYHAGLGHYFMSSDPPEIAGLDTGYFPGWTRTGESFKAYATGSSAGATMNPVCRYFKWPVGGVTTHFYSANGYECWLVDDLFGAEWVIESDNVFQIDLPDMATGACPGGTVPVYRLWNGVLPTNHRYTTSLAVRANMIALGWVPEGYGPIGVAMCAVP